MTGRIEREAALEAMKKLHDYCDERDCSDCLFDNGAYGVCKNSQQQPNQRDVEQGG